MRNRIRPTLLAASTLLALALATETSHADPPKGPAKPGKCAVAAGVGAEAGVGGWVLLGLVAGAAAARRRFLR